MRIALLCPARGAAQTSGSRKPKGTQIREYSQPLKLPEIDRGGGVPESSGTLGSKDASRSLAEQAHGQTGLDTGIIKQMLPMVASMLMGSLSKQASSAGVPGASASGLTGMLTSLLDADKDGSVVDDLMGMAGKLFR